ncbi:hypothetical protein CQW23_16470 [Capsicum baccatum]|uniref:Uncharacterized protein n=1 Tax=Capsicum baccatum TaxID=33114 RepID=A0A2G2WB17_CAPBA|nr:hypothetical protein CQW23_16470 [Capsicum baccatum]
MLGGVRIGNEVGVALLPNKSFLPDSSVRSAPRCHYILLEEEVQKQEFSITRYTTTNCFFKVYIDKAYVNYYNADVAKDLATQDAFTSTDEVTDMEMSVINTIKGLSTRTAVYAEYLSEGLGIPYSGIDAQYHRLRYATLLCKSGSKKAENGYFSKNNDPPRPRSKFAPK